MNQLKDVRQHGHERHVEPIARDDWIKDPPQLTPRASTAYTAMGNAYVATEISSSEKPSQKSPKGFFAEHFYQRIQRAQTCDTTKLENFREESDDHESSTQSYQRVPAAYMYPSDIPSNNLNESHTYNGTHSEDDCQPYRLTIDRVHCKVYTRAKLRPFRNWKYPAAQAFLTPHRDNRCR